MHLRQNFGKNADQGLRDRNLRRAHENEQVQQIEGARWLPLENEEGQKEKGQKEEGQVRRRLNRVQAPVVLCIDHWLCGGAREDRVEMCDTLVGSRVGVG